MNTSFVISSDGYRIAYDVIGEGEPILLLHGAGEGFDRQTWHKAGYVKQLQKHGYKVINMDIRGNGESDKPLQSSSHNIDQLCDDILCVADACGIDKFAVWGFSYGANIGRYLASKSTRVSKFIMIGGGFGEGAPGPFHQHFSDLRDHWLPILKSQADGNLDVQSLSQEDQEMLQNTDIPFLIAWSSAILDWGSIYPENLLCPTLCLVGSRNDLSMNNLKEYEGSLRTLDVDVRIQIIDGLDHMQEFFEIDKVLPVMLAYMKE